MISSPTAPNPNTLMADLRMMPDQQLFQYAQMHKNDPYIFPMVFQESNARKKLRAAQNIQAPPAPKVVDQNLQEMAQPMPEEQGIATLPAPNMQNMAGGGIVAFAGGGDVPGFQSGAFLGQLTAEQIAELYKTDPKLAAEAEVRASRSVVGNTLGKSLTPVARAALPVALGAELFYTSPEQVERVRALEAKKTPAARTAAAQSILNESPEDYAARKVAELEAQGGKQLSPDARNMAMSQFVKDKIAGQVKRGEASFTSSGQLPAPANVYTGTALPGLTPSGKTPLGAKPPLAVAGAPSSAAPVSTAPAGLAALNTKPMSAEDAMAAAGKFGDDKAMRAELQGYVDRQKKVGEQAVGSFEKGIAGLPEAYKKYEARLQKEEAEADTDKNKAIGMSIFKAGLAMMAGTSQNAFENIGKGAMVGLEDQQAALKDFKKAQRERDRAFADIEAARLADQRGDLKTKLELENRAADRVSNAEGRMVEGITKLFDTNKTNARGIYQTGIEQANQNQRTLTQINADIQRQGMSDRAAMERTNAQVLGAQRVAQLNADTYKLPMLYKSVEDSVDKMLQADINYKVADEATKTTMRNAALQKRLLATPGLAQYAGAPAGGAKFLGFENPK